ncbi:MAG: DUF2231 domain-containing protein [Acidobacteriota bacterium]
MVPHSVVVDFAVALLITSMACDLLGRVAEEDDLVTVATWTLYFGTMAAGFAVLSGYAAHDLAAPTGAAGETALSHRNAALVTLSCFAACTIWRLRGHGEIRGRWCGLYWLIASVGLGSLVVTGWLGGRLVFFHGVGVGL